MRKKSKSKFEVSFLRILQTAENKKTSKIFETIFCPFHLSPSVLLVTWSSNKADLTFISFKDRNKPQHPLLRNFQFRITPCFSLHRRQTKMFNISRGFTEFNSGSFCQPIPCKKDHDRSQNFGFFLYQKNSLGDYYCTSIQNKDLTQTSLIFIFCLSHW